MILINDIALEISIIVNPFWPLAFNLCQMRRLAGSLSEQRFSYGLSTASTVKMIHRCSSSILHFHFSFYPPLFGVLPGISRQGNNFIALSLRCNADKRFFHQFHSFYHWSKRAFSILFIPDCLRRASGLLICKMLSNKFRQMGSF